MVNNFLASIGYISGIIIFKFFDIWQIVYILPAFLSCFHLYLTTKFYKERPKLDRELRKLAKQNTSLMFSYVIGSGMSYIDRIFLYPVMGGPVVSTYQVSTLMGKLYSLASAPINMVILSYTAKVEDISKKNIVYVIIPVSIFGLLYAILSIEISPFIIKLFYPQYYDLAALYIPVVTIAITIFNVTTIISGYFYEDLRSPYNICN